MDEHPDKTFNGRIENGLDFLGYHFSPKGLSFAQKTIDNFVEEALRLYEQEPPHLTMKRLGEDCDRWARGLASQLLVASALSLIDLYRDSTPWSEIEWRLRVPLELHLVGVGVGD